MSSMWQPLLKPPKPRSISIMSDDAEKILAVIVKDSILGNNCKSNFDRRQHFERNSNISFNGKRNFINSNGDFVSEKKSISVEMEKNEVPCLNLTFPGIGDDVTSITSNFRTNWRCDFNKMAFEEYSWGPNIIYQNKTNKNHFGSNSPGEAITNGTASRIVQLEEPQLFVMKEKPFTKKKSKRPHNFLKVIENYRSYPGQKKKGLRQLRIDDYFVPSKKQKNEKFKEHFH